MSTPHQFTPVHFDGHGLNITAGPLKGSRLLTFPDCMKEDANDSLGDALAGAINHFAELRAALERLSALHDDEGMTSPEGDNARRILTKTANVNLP